MHTTSRPEDLPIACTLTPGDLSRRADEIASLNRSALRVHARDGLILELTYAPEAAERVRALVDAERRCCAFLTFRITETGDAIRLTIVAPDAARDSLEEIFSPFLGGVHTP